MIEQGQVVGHRMPAVLQPSQAPVEDTPATIVSRPGLLAAAGLVLFCLLAVLNSGGYQYGTGDQAFYVPAIFLDLQPELFPRDRPLLQAQKSFTPLDDWIAAVCRHTGWSLPAVFLIAFSATLGLLAVSYAALGRILYRSPWSVLALQIAMTFRHRITKTGVNTLENYFHPRMLAFAIGVAAIVALWRGRSWVAIVLALGAAIFHSTTAIWFAVFIGGALIASDLRRRSSWLVPGIVLTASGATWIWLGPLRNRVAPMDDLWLSVLGTKDYIFPTEWSWSSWCANLAYPIIIFGIFRYRQRSGIARPREASIVAGCAALLVLFFVSLPLVALRIALALQLQTSRVFWLLDLIATAYVIWALVDGAPARRRPAWRRPALVTLLAIAALARGAYVTFVEHAGRPVVQIDLPADDWTDVMRWALATPATSHILADPGHAWRYGSSVRVAARRDVFLEEVKDASMALYSRPVAMRVAERTLQLGNFRMLTADTARALARRYDLDLLVTENTVPDLPEAYRRGRFRVYRLR